MAVKKSFCIRLTTLALLLIGSKYQAYGQCAMCRAVLESNGDTSVAEGINNGIVYLMAIQYTVVHPLFLSQYRKIN